MTTVLNFAILGLGAGAVYALLAQGIVLIYRGSGTVNFAHGAMAMMGAYVFWELHDQSGWSFTASTICAVLLVAAIAGFTQVAIMRPLATAAPLVRVSVTLGILIILQATAALIWGGLAQLVPSSLPTTVWHAGHVIFPENQVYLLVIAVAISAMLFVAYRYTRFGLAVAGGAENEIAIGALGWSPQLLATVNWTLGGALAAISGILIVPLVGLDTTTLTLIVIAGLAAALLGGFSSFPLTLLGGLGIGIAQSEMANYIHTQGISDAVPFLVIILILIVRGKALPLRSHINERLPKLGSGSLPIWVIPLAIILTVLAFTAFPSNWNIAFATSVATAVILLSLVVLTGYAGQISLGQFAIAGFAAWIAGRLVAAEGVPFALALVVGIAAGVGAGLIFALPALRTRGINLAVVTLGLGLAVEQILFDNANYTGGIVGTNVGATHIFGINIDEVKYPNRYALFTGICFVLCAFFVLKIRRGRSGRKLIAVRTNERAAASLGVSTFLTKLYAFGIGSAIAGVGGILLAFQQHDVVFTNFDTLGSVNLVVLTVLGGIGFIGGPLVGSILVAGGVGSLIGQNFANLGNWLLLVSGVIVVLQLLKAPDGAGQLIALGTNRLRHRNSFLRGPSPISVELNSAHPLQHVERFSVHDQETAGALVAENITVRLGGIFALHDVSLSIYPGEVVGLIGANGSGKTTLIDTLTGFVRPVRGTIHLNDQPINTWSPAHRARAGVTRTFQSAELFEDISVLDNLRIGSDSLKRKNHLFDIFRFTEADLEDEVVRAIHDLQLEDVLERTPSELSFGKRRLVSIARALSVRPRYLLLDEPAAGLNDLETTELSQLIRNLAEQWHLGVLLVEHDTGLVMDVCDRLVVLNLGQVLAEGHPLDVAALPEVKNAYLGTGGSPTNDVEIEGHEIADEKLFR